MKQVLLLLGCLLHCTQGEEDPWSFIVLSDWHNAENFALRPYDHLTPQVQTKTSVIQYIKQNHGGDLVLIPGDVTVGHWDSPSFTEKFRKVHGDHNLTTPEIVQQAASNCYTGLLKTFSMGGYDTVLMAVGDHELGDNPWLASTSHTDMIQHFRQGFQSVMNRNTSTGDFIYSKPIGTIPSRPVGTRFENTSYAYQHKNVLFVTVDVFDIISTQNYLNRTIGYGGEGVVVCNVQGDHLIWFESILRQARTDSTIQHILVQGHVPILLPVRKINSSAMTLLMGQESDFFKVMQKYHVDIYFAGEVHTNTVTKHQQSNILQVVSRGNGFNNFMVVHVTTDLDITLYNEIGPEPKYNQQYEWFGSLTISKSLAQVNVVSRGQLEILDLDAPLLYFNFEKMISLGTRVVLGLPHDFADETLTQSQITIRNIVCRNSLINHGSFGQQYDAQVSLELVDSGSFKKLGTVGLFTRDSRMAIWGMGPASGGMIVSYSCWFRTYIQSKMVLIHYGETFANREGMASHEPEKDIFTLALEKGVPCLYRNVQSKLYAEFSPNLANGQWHHIAVSMSRKSCLLSQVHMFIDGIEVKTKLEGLDENLFLTSSGKLGIGGYGSSGSAYDTDYDLNPFEGWLDEVSVWGRSLNETDISRLFSVSMSINPTSSLRHASSGTDDQISRDIQLTVTILFIGSLMFVGCVWCQQKSRLRRTTNELHIH